MSDLIVSSKGYQDLLSLLKNRIRTAQVRAALAVNSELVLLYWGIGKEILARQQHEGWGTKVIDLLAKDLRHTFPGTQGFSTRKLHEGFSGSLARRINCAAGCCTIALVPQLRPAGQSEDQTGTAMVHPTGDPEWLEPECAGHAD